MKTVKLSLALAGLLAALQYSFVYYNSMGYRAFVKEAAMHARIKNQLRADLLEEAKSYSLPVIPSNIAITTSGPVFRVAVNYSVPINLLICNPELKFSAVGSGILQEE